MDRPRSRELQITDQLSAILDKHQGQHAVDCNTSRYITLHELKEFWTDEKIREACRNFGDHRYTLLESYDTIRGKFIRVFTLLVWIDRLERMQDSFMKYSLTDESFPLQRFPPDWEKTPARDTLFEEIDKAQWMFFPCIFDPLELYSQTLSPRHIIPISEVRPIQEGTGATVHLIHVDPLCVGVVEPRRSGPIRLVRKQYVGEEHQHAYWRERKALQALRWHKLKSSNVVAYFGSFSQKQYDGKTAHNLVLEYVDGGTLDQLYHERKPPGDRDELVQFWNSFSGALEALYVVHHATRESGADDSYSQIVHQDIRPSNYLISWESLLTPHKFTIKLADFGYSVTHVRKSDDQDKPDIKDSGGGQTYGAPENSHHELFTHHGLNRITPAVDVWSTGCVFSEAFAWLVEPERGRHEYEKRRTLEINQHTRLKDAGHAGCFHNGHKRLEEIDKTHKRVKELLPDYDDITPRIIEMVESGMLQPIDFGRRVPYALLQEMRSFLGNVGANTGDVVSEGVRSLSFSASQAHQKTFPGPLSVIPTLAQSRVLTIRCSYEEAREFYICMKARLLAGKQTTGTIDSLRRSLRDRDFVFFIDNSTSMWKHRKPIREALQTYAYIIKKIDTDGFEAVFASEPRNMTKHTNSTSLLQVFDMQRWNQFTFEDKLQNFIDAKISDHLPAAWKIWRRPKPLSIFVLTDGRWGHDMSKACGIERPITKLINKMKEIDAARTQVSIQFMRFGDDEDGIRYLNYLDHLGKARDMDIVDTRPYDSDVCSMLIGSVDQARDEDGETPLSTNGTTSLPFQSRFS